MLACVICFYFRAERQNAIWSLQELHCSLVNCLRWSAVKSGLILSSLKMLISVLSNKAVLGLARKLLRTIQCNKKGLFIPQTIFYELIIGCNLGSLKVTYAIAKKEVFTKPKYCNFLKFGWKWFTSFLSISSSR